MRTAKLGTILITSILLMLIPTTRVQADPKPKTQATPDQLMPHVGPKPIPDIHNYRIVTILLLPYLDYDTPKQEPDLNIRFSTPEGYLCTIHVGPHYPHDIEHFNTSCIGHHFPGIPAYYPQFNKNDRAAYESIRMDNMMPPSTFPEAAPPLIGNHDPGLNDLTAYDHGDHTKYPLLQPGSIITYTPPYSTKLYRGYKITPKPASCALGYNHTLWCVSHLLFNEENTPYTDPNSKLAEFYVTPTETQFSYP